MSKTVNSMQQIQSILLAGPEVGEGRADSASTWFWKF